MSSDRISRPLRVLHVAPTPFFSDRGCHMRIRGIIHALNRLPVSNVLCTYHLGRDIEGIDCIRTATIPGYTKLEAGPSGYKYLADILLFFKLCATIHKRRPDIIHGHLHEGALLGWAARLCFFWRRIPLVFDMQGSLVGELDEHGYFTRLPWLRRLFLGVEHLITRMPDHLVCSSTNGMAILQSTFHIDPSRVTLVSDAADVCTDTDSIITRASLGIPDDRTIVVYTGALLEAKGLSNLYRMMLDVRRRNFAVHFLIIGYPEEPVQAFCREHRIEDFCTIVGRVPYERLGSYLKVADVAVEPKFSESGEASGKLMNYMCSGLPVVCYDTPANRHILGELGYYARRDGEDDLARQLEVVLSQLQTACRRGEAAKRRAENEFTWDAAAQRLVTIYNGCLCKVGHEASKCE